MNGRRKIGMVCLLVVGILASYSVMEPYWLEENHVIIESLEIPEAFDRTKIVFLADIHHGPFFSLARLGKVIQRVNNLNPDIILLGGDYVHRSPKYIEPCFAELGKLRATHGVYGVLGNHDHWEDPDLTRKCMDQGGIHLIDNKAFWIWKNGQRIKIGGVGDFYDDIQNIDPTVGGVGVEDFVILVTHNPDYVERIETDKIDLVFAGHTHGGQVTFFGLWAPLIPSLHGQKYRTGSVKRAETKVLISNGIGTVTPPVRFFARPQIIVAELRRG